ncbi:hypothetical protein D3C86_2253190 [compost metagenome]
MVCWSVTLASAFHSSGTYNTLRFFSSLMTSTLRVSTYFRLAGLSKVLLTFTNCLDWRQS